MSVTSGFVMAMSEYGDETIPLPCHANSMKAWETLYGNQDLSDVTFIVGEENMEFKAHRLVLAAHSDVMKSMLYGKMKESQEDVIKLPNVHGVSFRALLEFFYIGRVGVSKSCICELIKLCDYFNVQELKRVCFSWLSKNLCVDDVCHYLMFAVDADEELHSNCLNWLDDRIAVVIKTEGFIQMLNREQLQNVFARDSLDVHEIDLFDSLVSWVKYDPETRRDDGRAVAKFIRLPMMTPAQLLVKVQCSGLVDVADFVKALTLLQQPGSTNSYEEESPATVLRLPRISYRYNRLMWSQPFGNGQSVSDGVKFVKPNLAIVEATHRWHVIDLRTTEIAVPSSIRVQVFSESSASYSDLKVGFEINQRIKFKYDRNKYEYRNQPSEIIGATVSGSVAKLGDSRLVSVPVGCAMYFSLYITEATLCTQVNGTTSATTSTTASAKCRTAQEETVESSTYKLLVRVTGPTERTTFAIREDKLPTITGSST